ncbi:hypothetical protein [Polycladidibacter stylochi]|uniref:hypothetical protein n=1 Tax=Polycladidibacter stylochi TaxID=1807766 RepID=UPI00082CB5F8|nr:hypothetical protein [Pseudovibrio stylochi]
MKKSPRSVSLGLVAAGILFSTSALASPALESIDALNNWLKTAGFEKAAYESAEEKGDTLTLQNYTLSLPFSLNADGDSITGSFSIVYDSLDLKGFEKNTNSYFVKEAFSPLSHMDFNYTVSTSKTIVGKDGKTKTVVTPYSQKLKFTIEDTRTLDWVLPQLSEIKQDPAKPISGYISLVNEFMQGGYSLSTTGKITSEQSDSLGASSKATVATTKVTNAKDGMIEAIEYGKQISSQLTPIGESGKTLRIEAELDTGGLKNINIRPLLAMLNGQKSDEKTLVSSGAYGQISYEIFGEKGFETIDAGKPIAKVISKGSELRDIEWYGGNFTQLFSMVDQAYLGNDPKVENPADLIAQMGNFRIGSIKDKGATFEVLQPIQLNKSTIPALTAKYDGMALEELTNTSLGAFEFTGLHVNKAMPVPEINLDKLRVANVSWLPVSEIVKLAKDKTLSESEKGMKMAPEIGEILLSGIKFDMGLSDKPEFRLDEIHLTNSNYVGAFPTNMRLKTEHLAYNAMLLGNAQMRLPFGNISLPYPVINQDLQIKWDEAKQTLDLKNLMFEVEDGIMATAKLSFGGIPKQIFEDPENAQLAMMSATFNGGEVVIKDAQLIKEALENGAQKAGVSLDDYIEQQGTILTMLMGPISKSEFAANLVDAFKTFGKNPNELVIELAPEKPVALIALGALAGMQPEKLPEELGASVFVKQ